MPKAKYKRKGAVGEEGGEAGEGGEPAAKRSLVCHLGEREKGRGERGSSFTILDLPEEMICQVRSGCPATDVPSTAYCTFPAWPGARPAASLGGRRHGESL